MPKKTTTRQVFGHNQVRLYVMSVCLLLPVLIIGYRLIQVQVFRAAEFRSKATAQQSRQFEIPARRGEIFVADNDELYPIALNDRQKYLYVDPKIITDPAMTAEKLSQATGLDRTKLEKDLTFNGTVRYIELKQRIGQDEAQVISKLKLVGVILKDRDYRYYPEGALFGHILGYVNADSKGQYGVEEYFNDQLSGKDGKLKAVTDNQGIPIATQDNVLTKPIDGRGVVLTIDRYVQGIAQKALKTAIDTNKSPSGSIIVMEPKTGAIKAMVNYPDYDPNNYGAVKPESYSNFLNSSITNLFEPGSGFKPLTMAIGLKSGKIKPDSTFNDTGSTTIGEYTITNAEKKSFGTVDMSLVIKNSINTGMVYILRMMGGDPNKITRAGKDILYAGIQEFGFGKKTGIELAGEASGRIKEPKAADIDYANMTFGQGIAVTNIQMISAIASIANGGKLVSPHVIDKEFTTEGTLKPVEHKPRNEQVMSEQTARDVAQMMIKVVEGGSGYLTRIPGYKIAGKTGTAQVPRADGKGYEENKNIGSFIGFAPVESPKFVMLVRIDYPQTNTFAERSAVPAFAEVTKELFKYYQVPPN
ncbi:MAG: penicillin-binding protein 2 [bacterium]